MSYIPTPEQAMTLVRQYNQEPFHLEHAETVGKVLAYFARTEDPERVDYWRAVGILHDIDFAQWPEQHCVKARELLRELDIDETVIHAVISHGWGICIDVAPELSMEKVLFAVDELTGLIGAAARMRPTGLEGMEASSLRKKFKDRKFAAKCDREVILRGCELLGMELREVAELCIEGMRPHAAELGLQGTEAGE